MKTPLTPTGLLLASLVFAAGSQAAGVQTRTEGGMLCGQADVSASPGQPYQATGPVQQRSEGYLLWEQGSQASAMRHSGSVRLADDLRMATDLINGS